MTKLSINPKDTWAVLIGVGKFNYPGLSEIPAVSCNLLKLRQLLENPAIVGIPHKQIVTIKNEVDTLQQIKLKLPDRPLNTLFVYYAGHGISDSGQQLCLALPNTLEGDPQTALSFALLSNNTVNRATNLVYILDCCFSGKGLKVVAPSPKQKVSVLTATLPSDSALKSTKSTGESHTAYTAYTDLLIELLEKGFGNEPSLTTKEIRKELKERCLRKGLPEPWGYDFSDEPLQIAYNRSHFPKGTSVAEKTQKTVFLAKVTSDLIDDLDNVRNSLNQRNDIRVLATQDYGDCSKKLTEDLKKSDLFVQLLSDSPGEENLVKTQYDRANATGIAILQWYSSKSSNLVDMQTEAHHQWLNDIDDEVRKGSLIEFGEEIIDNLELPKIPESLTVTSLTAGALIVVSSSQEDTCLLENIIGFLTVKKLDYVPAIKVSGAYSAMKGLRGEKKYQLACDDCFSISNFVGKADLKWLLLSHPTITPELNVPNKPTHFNDGKDE